MERKGSEVTNMLIAEYSYEEDIEVKQQEARQQGLEQGLEQGMERGREEGLLLSGKIFQMLKNNLNLTNEQIAEKLGCKTDEVENTRKMFEI